MSTSVSLKYFWSTFIIVLFVNLFIAISLSFLFFQINFIFSFLAHIFIKSFTEFEVLVAMTKSSLAASSSTYESMTKAAKQVFDIVDSNIEAASKAGESVVSQPVGKAKGKKAA